MFRHRVAQRRGCDPDDHFDMLAACGADLPGNVYARPVTLSRDDLAVYVTQNQDALEMTVTAEPMEDGGIAIRHSAGPWQFLRWRYQAGFDSIVAQWIGGASVAITGA